MHRRPILVAPLVFAVTIAAPLHAQCGGVERWAIKMAADPAAAGLATATPVATTFHDLLQLPRPASLTTRAATEQVVRVVDAYLVKFKKEAGKDGDQDYHLVISDQTLQYTQSGDTIPSPHSFIAEIPDPDCVSGRNSTVTTPSHVQAQLQSVRTAFEQHFPNISSGWNEAHGIPVRLTGVVFFDFPHGQVGRSPRTLELHPLLKIEFNPTTTVATAPTSPGLVNAGFESGDSGWTATTGVLVSGNEPPPSEGTRRAWLGGHGARATDQLWQQVTLPATATAISMTFALRVETEEEGTVPYDSLRVRIRDANGTFLKNAAIFTNLHASNSYVLRSVDLSAYRGRTVRLSFESKEDGSSATSFVVDDVRLVIESP